MNKIDVDLPFGIPAEDASLQFITNGQQDEYRQVRHSFLVESVDIQAQQLHWSLKLETMETETYGLIDSQRGVFEAKDEVTDADSDATLDFTQQASLQDFVVSRIASKVGDIEEKIDATNKDITKESRRAKISAALSTVMIAFAIKFGIDANDVPQGETPPQFIAAFMLGMGAFFTLMDSAMSRGGVKSDRRIVDESLQPERDRLTAIAEEIKAHGLQVI